MSRSICHPNKYFIWIEFWPLPIQWSHNFVKFQMNKNILSFHISRKFMLLNKKWWKFQERSDLNFQKQNSQRNKRISQRKNSQYNEISSVLPTKFQFSNENMIKLSCVLSNKTNKLKFDYIIHWLIKFDLHKIPRQPISKNMCTWIDINWCISVADYQHFVVY